MVKSLLILLKYLQQIESKRAIQKTAEATEDLVGNTIANKITNKIRYKYLKKTNK